MQGAGVMDTHDEETRSFFQGSNVHCRVIGRAGGKGNSVMQSQAASTFFSHHQKTLVCDTPVSSGPRRLLAFVGGLDLTTGACYYNHVFWLFGLLQTAECVRYT